MSAPVLYLEPVGGIAGDMFLAAMLDLGVDAKALEVVLRTLGLDGWGFEVTRAIRQDISGVQLHVRLDPEVPHVHRALSEILGAHRARARSPPGPRSRPGRCSRSSAARRRRIHDVPLESVHFHEVGAVDSIVDVCGAALALELLGQPEVLSAPPPLGSGMVETMHGRLPVPAPATLEILRDLPVRFEGAGRAHHPHRCGPAPRPLPARVRRRRSPCGTGGLRARPPRAARPPQRAPRHPGHPGRGRGGRTSGSWRSRSTMPRPSCSGTWWSGSSPTGRSTPGWPR